MDLLIDLNGALTPSGLHKGGTFLSSFQKLKKEVMCLRLFLSASILSGANVHTPHPQIFAHASILICDVIVDSLCLNVS